MIIAAFDTPTFLILPTDFMPEFVDFEGAEDAFFPKVSVP